MASEAEALALALHEVPRLTEMQLQTQEVQLDAELELGRYDEVIPELRRLAGLHPLREQFHAFLMLAPYRCGASCGSAGRLPGCPQGAGRGTRRPPIAAGDALAVFLRALGVPGREIPPEPEERAACYPSRLAGSRTLILLDNAASEEQVRPLPPATPGSMAVVTSRRMLSGLVAREGA